MSSVNGSNNPFYRRRMAGEVWYPGSRIAKGITRVFILDWRDHPGKSQEWYDLRRKKWIDEGMLHIFAQEVDRDYSGSVERIIIPQAWVLAAVDAHKALGIAADGEKIAAQDVADGGSDKNALAIRHGVVLKFAEHWGGEAGDAAQIAIPHCAQYQAQELYYDSIGVGAGFKTQINTMRQQKSFPVRLRVLPWNAGEGPLDPTDHIIPEDMQSPTNEDQYLNLKAQAWFRLRTRFYKTFRAIRHKEIFPHEELISLDSTIPRLHELKMQLSQATHTANAKGKTIVDKQPDGSISPNLADSVVMAYSPTREVSIFDVI